MVVRATEPDRSMLSKAFSLGIIHGDADPSPVPRRKPASERFEGFVERLEADAAYVSLASERGERLHGPYPADELTAKGVGERDRFWLTLTDLGDSVQFDIQLIPRKIVSAERQAEIIERSRRPSKAIPEKMIIDPPRLEVHILGAGKGEVSSFGSPMANGEWSIAWPGSARTPMRTPRSDSFRNRARRSWNSSP